METKQNHVIVVDDDKEIRELLKEYLEKNGMKVSTAEHGESFFEIYPSNPADLVILDIMMPGDDGLKICNKIRTYSNIPVIMLTAAGDPTDKIIGLELGADDYMEKPFNPRELLARIKAIFRRSEQGGAKQPGSKQFISFGHWRLNTVSRQLHNKITNEVIALSGADYNLLLTFLENPGKTLSRDDLSNTIKGRDTSPYDRSIDVQVSRLRQRLGDDGKTPQIIKTIRGSGYILAADISYS